MSKEAIGEIAKKIHDREAQKASDLHSHALERLAKRQAADEARLAKEAALEDETEGPDSVA